MNETKEVLYSKYCPKCKHKAKPEGLDPCHECLNQPWNIDSHKPIKFEEAKKR